MTDIERIASTPEPTPSAPPTSMRETLRWVEQAWHAFRAAAARFPNERMDEHLTEGGWTRKQMLAHIAAWHDLTTDRLGKLIAAGQPADLDEADDVINARVARRAIGRTAGEVIKDMEATFNRLHRLLQHMTDAQLLAHDAWAAQVIAGNTYKHYAEHFAEVYVPEPPEGAARRR